jgi:hypothetical protein
VGWVVEGWRGWRALTNNCKGVRGGGQLTRDIGGVAEVHCNPGPTLEALPSSSRCVRKWDACFGARGTVMQLRI